MKPGESSEWPDILSAICARVRHANVFGPRSYALTVSVDRYTYLRCSGCGALYDG